MLSFVSLTTTDGVFLFTKMNVHELFPQDTLEPSLAQPALFGNIHHSKRSELTFSSTLIVLAAPAAPSDSQTKGASFRPPRTYLNSFIQTLASVDEGLVVCSFLGSRTRHIYPRDSSTSRNALAPGSSPLFLGSPTGKYIWC